MKVRSRLRRKRCETICAQIVELLCVRWDERKAELELELELGAANPEEGGEGDAFPTIQARGLRHRDAHAAADASAPAGTA